MKKIMLLPIVFCCAANLFAQNYHATDAGSEVKFTIKNFGLTVTGSFKGLQGAVIFDPANTGASSVNVSVDAATVNTGNGSRDKHLKKDDYFDVVKYPKLSFVSTKITGKPGAYSIQGNLTIKGISKSVSFPFTATAVAGGYLLSGNFKINRRDFNVGGSSWVLSDDLTVSLNVSAIK
jgi:polyisoprenoid-binding protein YceI